VWHHIYYCVIFILKETYPVYHRSSCQLPTGVLVYCIHDVGGEVGEWWGGWGVGGGCCDMRLQLGGGVGVGGGGVDREMVGCVSMSGRVFFY
jgi:hypothetical protein